MTFDYAHWNQLHRKTPGLAAPEVNGWTPNTDVCECADGIYIKMELAGVPKESIAISQEEDWLIVEGVRRDPYGGASAAGYRFQQMEIEYGPFRRAIRMPWAIDGRKAVARMENGILTVNLPRAPETPPTKIIVSMER